MQKTYGLVSGRGGSSLHKAGNDEGSEKKNLPDFGEASSFV